jgi:hypothetical protein
MLSGCLNVQGTGGISTRQLRKLAGCNVSCNPYSCISADSIRPFLEKQVSCAKLNFSGWDGVLRLFTTESARIVGEPPQRSRPASSSAWAIGETRYWMMRRSPVLISAWTARPGPIGRRRPATPIQRRFNRMRAV